jgi:hypothetical protein
VIAVTAALAAAAVAAAIIWNQAHLRRILRQYETTISTGRTGH